MKEGEPRKEEEKVCGTSGLTRLILPRTIFDLEAGGFRPFVPEPWSPGDHRRGFWSLSGKQEKLCLWSVEGP